MAKNMHSDPMKVQMATFRLSNPVEVFGMNARAACAVKTISFTQPPAGSKAHLNTPNNTSPKDATTGTIPV